MTSFVAAIISVCLLSNPSSCPISEATQIDHKACHTPSYQLQKDIGDGKGVQTFVFRIVC